METINNKELKEKVRVIDIKRNNNPNLNDIK